MRIGIDARMLGFAPGIGRYIEELSQHIFAVDRKNEYIMFLREPVFSAYDAGSPMVKKVLAPERWYSFGEQLLWPIRLRREKLDLLLVPQFNVPLLVPCPFVVTIHDVTQLYVPGILQKKSRLHRLAFRWTFQRAIARARAVIAVSEYTKNEIVKNFGVRPEKIHIIYEGLGLTLQPEILNSKSDLPVRSLPERRSRAGWAKAGARNNAKIQNTNNQKRFEFRNSDFEFPHSEYILAVGVWRPHKNFEGLLQAFALLKKDPRFTGLKLVLAGEEDPRYSRVRESIHKFGLSREVITPGTPGDVELNKLYRGARLVIVPSFFEGFGFVGLEALARNVPVAASDTAALPEILGDAAIYFNPRDLQSMTATIEKALLNEEERKRILAAAPAILSRYSWSDAAKKTLDLLLKSSPSR